MKEPTFKIEAQSFFDAALAIEAGVKQGYKIETDDLAFFPQQFGHYYFLTMVSAEDTKVEDNSTTVAEKDTAVEDNSAEPEVAAVAPEEAAKAVTRKRKPKAEEPDPVVLPADSPNE